MIDSANNPPRVSMTGISKSFGPVSVLEDVDFELLAGERHVLAGENGAGKSTLIKILAGVHTDFDGLIEIDGKQVRPRTPLEAGAHGIAVIHQELSLIGPMTVADNLFLGRMKSAGGMVCRRQQEDDARGWLAGLGVDIDVRRPVEEFPIATRQCIEIAKALSRQAIAIVMDEPTSALSEPEVERLFEMIGPITAQGCGVIYITHKMEEIARIADRITVLRDGHRVGTATAAELPRSKLIQWMVGRTVNEQYVRRSSHAGARRLLLDRVSIHRSGRGRKSVVKDVSMEIRRGEVVGLGGLQGSGAGELLLGLFGGLGEVRGRIELDDKPYVVSSPGQAIGLGVALLTNDRKGTGLVCPMSVTANVTMASLRQFTRFGWLRKNREKSAAQQSTSSLQLQAASLEMPVESLSGGNQQKVAIAKWLQIAPRLLLLDEPTRGIDVGAKQEIYELIEQWTASGISILLITSEMPELLALSDRIVVLHRGSITAELDRSEAGAEKVLAAAMGT
jgi:ABC-type sugar transport system ATPase subunit